MAVRFVRLLLCTVFMPLVAYAVVNVLLGDGVHGMCQVTHDPERRFWVELRQAPCCAVAVYLVASPDGLSHRFVHTFLDAVNVRYLDFSAIFCRVVPGFPFVYAWIGDFWTGRAGVFLNYLP